MQIALSKYNYFKISILLLFVLLGLGTYILLSNKVCLFCPIEIPLDYQTEDHVHTVANKDGIILLFRGVHAQHPDLGNAKMGIATPIGGHDDAKLHNDGNNKSVFTSWTNDIWWANKFAYKHGHGGIILMKHFKTSEIVPSQDKFQQGEFLVRGIVTGALPVPAFKP